MKKYKILVIDDDSLVLKTTSKILKREGYETFTAATREEAIKQFKEIRPEIIITDVRMPRTDGIDLINEMKIKNVRSKYIIMTEVDNEDAIARAIRAGVNDYIYKPFEIDEFVACVDRNIKTFQLEIDNSKLEEENLQNAKLAAIGNMTNTLVHDVKNSMTTIIGFSQMLRNRNLPQEKVDRYVDLVTEQSNLILDKLKEINEFSRGKINLNISEITIEKLYNSIISEYNEFLNLKGVKFSHTINEELKNSSIIIDLERIKQVFFNLIGNSIDAVTQNPDKQISVVFEKSNSSLIIILKDNGKGIPEENIEKIFDPFFTHGKKNGTGLGLAIVREIIEKNQGEIGIKSKLGEWTEFQIKFKLN